MLTGYPYLYQDGPGSTFTRRIRTEIRRSGADISCLDRNCISREIPAFITSSLSTLNKCCSDNNRDWRNPCLSTWQLGTIRKVQMV